MEIFGLSKPYTKKDILAAYKALSLRFHPDKNLAIQAEATAVFKLLGAAKDYLLFTISEYTEDISNNIFYEATPSTIKKTDDKPAFSDLLRKFAREPKNQGVIDKLKDYILQNKELLRCDSGEPLEKTALYLASQLNQVEFFQWLLEQGADPTFKQPFGLTTLDDAIIYDRTLILELIKAKYGKPWLEKTLTETLLATKTSRVANKSLAYINKHCFPKTKNFILTALQKNPYLIPNLSTLGYITIEEEIQLLKSKIKGGMPALYREMSEMQRQNLDLLVVTLAQRRSKAELLFVPYTKLPRHLIYALLDIWPDIGSFQPGLAGTPYEIRGSTAYQRSSTLALIITGAFNLLLATGLTLALVFPPASGGLGLVIFLGILLAMMLYSAIPATYDAVKKYQYKCKIKASLENNGFFKPTPANEVPEGLQPGYVK